MKLPSPILLAAVAFLPAVAVSAYDVGCMYPAAMPDPMEARFHLHQYSASYLMFLKVETPVVIHVSSLSSLCQVNCLAYHDDAVLDAITMERPLASTPPEYHNSWSRMLCMAQCFAIISYEAGRGDFYEPLWTKWGLEGIEPRKDSVGLGVLSAQQSGDATPLENLLANEDYHPFVVAQIVATEILLHATKDGWNALGSLTYDAETDTEVECTGNCERYKDTYGYFPRNHPTKRQENATSKYLVEGNDKYWAPLVDNDMNGFFMAQEHVTPHIGYKAKTKLYDSVEDFPTAPDPMYDFRQDALEVVERLKEAAADPLKKAKIAFFDNKLLVINMIENEVKKQFASDYSFEEECLYIEGMSTGEYEATLMSWREKVRHDIVRPTTVIQRWGSDMLTTFGGDKTVDEAVEIAARDFQAFQRVMPHSEYPSGSSCICTAYTEFTDAFTTGYYNANLTDLPFGEKSQEGRGYGCGSPALDPPLFTALGCEDDFVIPDLKTLLYECGQSRLDAGFHFAKSVTEGEKMCAGVGVKAWDHVQKIRNGSTLGSKFYQGDDRPQCSTFGAPGSTLDISKATKSGEEEGLAESSSSASSAKVVVEFWTTSLLFVFATGAAPLIAAFV